MKTKILEHSSTDTFRFHPLTIILLNLILPLAGSLFPSSNAQNFLVLSALFLLLIVQKYKRFMKAILYIILYYSIYYLVVTRSNSAVIISMFRMFLMFLPCLILATILIYDYNASELLSALQKARLPKTFIIGLTITLRYIPTFRDEFRLIKDSMKIRGLQFSLLHPARTFEYLLVPQLYRCLSLSGELTAAGLMKGIESPNKRTSYADMNIRLWDFLAVALFLIGYAVMHSEVISWKPF